MNFYTVKLHDETIKTMWAKNKKDLLHKVLTEYPEVKSVGLLHSNKSYWTVLYNKELDGEIK